MTKEEAIVYACAGLDGIRDIVNTLHIGQTKGQYFLVGRTKKQDLYRAIVAIQKIVNTIDEVVDEDVDENT